MPTTFRYGRIKPFKNVQTVLKLTRSAPFRFLQDKLVRATEQRGRTVRESCDPPFPVSQTNEYSH